MNILTLNKQYSKLKGWRSKCPTFHIAIRYASRASAQNFRIDFFSFSLSLINSQKRKNSETDFANNFLFLKFHGQ